jgi:hypothetical protein
MKNFTITKEDLILMDKAARRKAEIEAGIYGAFTKTRIYKSDKAYSRKNKHKKSIA